MKRREFLKLSATLTGAAMSVYLPAGWTLSDGFNVRPGGVTSR